MVMEFYTVEKRVKVWTGNGLEERAIHQYRKVRRTLGEATDDFVYEHPNAAGAIACIVIVGCILLAGFIEGSTWPA